MYLGIEIGGTKLQAAVGTAGEIQQLVRREVEPAGGAEGIREQLAEILPSLCGKYSIESIGIGFGGPLDVSKGIITKSHQVRGWDDFPLAVWIQDLVGLNCKIVNDCDAAALAEACLGAGQGVNRVFYVTVGTGIGGGFVVDRCIQGIDRPASNEIGHLRPGLDCSNREQTVESLASGRGIEHRMQDLIDQNNQNPDLFELKLDSFSNGLGLSAREICLIASEGNPPAVRILSEACQALGWAIAQTITLLAPEKVIVGGGVSLAGDKLFFDPVRRFTQEYVFPGLAESYTIVPASLREEVVLHGALLIANESHTRKFPC